MGALPKGPSPRVRGSRRHRPAAPQGLGSIPACAGEPRNRRRPTVRLRVHPRVCGGAAFEANSFGRGCMAGPSPRVRGSRGRGARAHTREGSIPACAGEPVLPGVQWEVAGVHPRVCGGAGSVPSLSHIQWGPSPRVRGSPLEVARPLPGRGSIPACAGEPQPCPSPIREAEKRVHPRVCGGASIRVGMPFRRHRRVHPRVCGGAHVSVSPMSATPGPSPRVRGSLVDPHLQAVERGSIPACAGEPLSTY